MVYKKQKVFEPIKLSFQIENDPGNTITNVFQGVSNAKQFSVVLTEFQTSGTLVGPMIKLCAIYNQSLTSKTLSTIGYRLVLLGSKVHTQDSSTSLLPPQSDTTNLYGTSGISNQEKLLTTLNDIYPDVGKRLWGSNIGFIDSNTGYSNSLRFDDSIRSKRKVQKGDQLVLIILQKDHTTAAKVLYNFELVTFLQTA